MEDIESEYISFPDIAKEMGVDIQTVHNWARYHRYFKFKPVFGRPVAKRSEFEEFKAARPELMKKETAGGAT